MDSLFLVLVTLAIGVAIFLLCRQVVLWYFRINQIADDLHVIANHYRKLNGVKIPTQQQYAGEVKSPLPIRP